MPNRIIKESIRTSRKINELPDFDFRFWAYLITYVDDFGRGSADPELLTGLVFPRRRDISEEQIRAALRELEEKGLIQLYEAEGEPYFCFPNWGDHQRVQSKRSRFPAPPSTETDNSALPLSTVDHGEAPPNPIQSNTESESKSESESESESESKAGVTPAPARESERADEDDDGYGGGTDDGFDAFWSAYPRKTGSIDKARAEYRHALDSGAEPAALLEAITWQAREWNETQEARYLPSAQRWLRNRGWEAKRGFGREPPSKVTASGRVSFEPDKLDRLLAEIDKI